MKFSSEFFEEARLFAYIAYAYMHLILCTDTLIILIISMNNYWVKCNIFLLKKSIFI